MDITLAFISTQIKWKEDTDILLTPSNKNGLKRESVLRLSKFATIDKNLALGRLGTLESKTLLQVNRNLIMILKLDDER